VLTYQIVDATQNPVSLTVPSDDEVVHPVDPSLGPWRISANVESADPDQPPTSVPEQLARVATATVSTIDMETGFVMTITEPQQEEAPATPEAQQADQLTTTSSALSNELAFNMQRQTQAQWGWAAVAASIAAFYQHFSVITQCQFASWVFRQTTCCTNGANSDCNRPFSTADALTRVGHLRASIPGRISLDQIQTEIDARRPIGVRIACTGNGNAHVVVICGYDTSGPQPMLQIKDPMGNATSIAFEHFPAQYLSSAVWRTTYLTKRA